MKILALAAAFAMATSASFAADKYTLDASHSQIVFSYQHLGFSTTYGMFSGFEGDISYDAEHPEKSSVTVSMPVTSIFTGWEKRDGHFLSPDLMNGAAGGAITFTSTGIEVTGDTTAKITGDLAVNDISKPVVLDAVLNKSDKHPQSGKDWVGFSATASLLRSDYGLGLAAPYVSDEVQVMISIEAEKVE
ncbi:YceI family protein [uncultured Litoreibacter sp.]|uniref:YceI family protein n=1 Tax=uncultured Litoreibacter sp. TaxID=1392394 RepID=UPI00262B8184|nr:YceI family protein [uncultured Litoreibacter sp.]